MILASYELRVRVDAGVIVAFLGVPLAEADAPGAAGVDGLNAVAGWVWELPARDAIEARVAECGIPTVAAVDAVAPWLTIAAGDPEPAALDDTAAPPPPAK